MAQEIQNITQVFNTNDTVTATSLNDLVSKASLLPAVISNQPDKPIPVADDTLLCLNSVGSQFASVKVGNLNLSGVISTKIDSEATKDITITPKDATIVTGKICTTNAGGLVNVVSSTAHGLVVDQIVLISASTNADLNGLQRITAVTTDSFTFVRDTATTVGTSSVSYTKKGLTKNVGNMISSGNVYTDGNSIINGTSKVVGNSTVNGNLSVTGTSTITGTTLQKGNLNSVGSINNVTLDPTTGAILKTFKVNPSFHYFVQTRTPAIYTITWGGIQNSTNLWGTEIVPLRLQFTPKKAGNKIILQWNVSAEVTDGQNCIYLVTRTIVSTGVEEPIKLNGVNLSVDDSNNTWSGVAPVGYDTDGSTTPTFNTIKIVDESSLDVECIYKLRVRKSQNSSSNFNLNRSGYTSSGLDSEIGMSMGHAHEICEI